MRPICQMACYWPARDTREHVWWTSPLPCPRSLPHSLSSECGYENPRTTISSTSVDRSSLEPPVLEARILWRRNGLNLDRPLHIRQAPRKSKVPGDTELPCPSAHCCA